MTQAVSFCIMGGTFHSGQHLEFISEEQTVIGLNQGGHTKGQPLQQEIRLDASNSMEQLMADIQGGSEEALEALYDLTSGRVFAIASRILNNKESAEEATLDVYTKIWEHADNYDPARGSVTVWISTLARNCSLDLLRKAMRQAHGAQEYRQATIPAHLSPEAFQAHTDNKHFIHQAMAKLSHSQQQLLLASYFGGWSHAEIAGLLRLPLGTVKTRIRNALALLRDDLGLT